MTDPYEALVRSELYDAAAAHEPDRTAMLNRIAANRAAYRRPRLQIMLRVAGSALAVATVLGIGGVARWALADNHGPDAAPAGPPPATAPIPTRSASPSPSPTSRPPSGRPHSDPPTSAAASATASASASRPEVRGHPGDTQVLKGSLSSDGSIHPADGDTAGQSDVTLEAHADLTALDLTIRVVRTPGLADQGATADATADGITATVEHQSEALLYHFVLRAGATLPAGTYVFSARYSHPAGSRNADDDTYEAFATDAAHKRPHVYGNFNATD